MDSKIKIRKEIYFVFYIVYLILHCKSHNIFPFVPEPLLFEPHVWSICFVVFMDFQLGSRRDSMSASCPRPRWSLTDPREDRVAPQWSSGGFVWQTWKSSKQNSPFFSVCVVWLWLKQNRTGNNQNHHYLLIISKPVIWLALKFEGWEAITKVKENWKGFIRRKIRRKNNALAHWLVRVVMSKWATGFHKPI